LYSHLVINNVNQEVHATSIAPPQTEAEKP